MGYLSALTKKMLIDNRVNRYLNQGYNIRTVWDFINEFAGNKSEQEGDLDIVTGYFTIRALSKLYHELPSGNHFRILSSEMVMQQEGDDHIIDLLNGDLGVDSSFCLDEYAHDAKAFLNRETVEVKAVVKAFCHAKAYIFKNRIARNDSFYLTGSSNLTDAGLGLKESSNIELTTGDPVKLTDKEYQEVSTWFNSLWKDAASTIPSDPSSPKSAPISVKEYFIQKIDDYYRKYSPEEIYYKILFELFNSDIELNNSIEHSKDISLLQTSEIWKTLFNYQQKGVISLIKMLRKYNGAILADAVGLGKTFSALAVIKYFQTQSYVTVLLCPKKLEQNWTQYLYRHGSRFDKDEFNYIVRFHTDLQNDRLQTAYEDAPLSWLQSRKKVLIVIDESHNLRNEKSIRYEELLTRLIQNRDETSGRDVKVLMLSATPINTGLNDVKGQFNLIGHGDDAAFAGDEFGVESLYNLFRESQKKYNQWCDNPIRTIGSFIAMLPPRFFNLTDKLIVARTRRLIEHTLGEDLGFPEQAKPINIYQGVDHFGKYRSTDEIYNAFDKLRLTAYQPSLYMYNSPKEAKKEAEKDWSDNVNRERFLVKMMSILFMKRLESSWNSCLTTIKKVLEVHESTLQKVIQYKQNKKQITIDIDLPDEDENFDTDDRFTLRKGIISLGKMKNLGGFEAGLRYDINRLQEIMESLEGFKEDYYNGFEEDLKLNKLVELIQKKQVGENKKIVIFTAYADTAQFIFDELQRKGFTRMAAVSGQSVSTTGHHTTSNFQEVLQSFAPYSKLYKEKDWSDLYEEAHVNREQYYDDAKQQWLVPYTLWQQLVRQYRRRTTVLIDDPIDILIATDCLSEGQNLQDADMQVNYDIHWNPVRLIQRFGRIDRIGSPNKIIQCVNFWPAESFEDYLNLEEKVMNRMAAMNLVGSETQELNDAYQQMIDDNPLQDKNADRLLRELQNNSISDIESPRTLSLKDFSFEVYRQDLLDYLEKYKDIFKQMPNGIFSGFKTVDDLFTSIPESLVAVVGYPHRTEGDTKPYTELYLMCQPVNPDLPASYKELNRAEVLEFLRQNKRLHRYVPDWIETNNEERLQRLSNIIKQWMQLQAPQQAIVERKNRFHSLGSTDKRTAEQERIDKKFQKENFDLIVWEYVSK